MIRNLSQQLGVGFGYDIDILPSMDKKDLLQIDENDIRWMRKTCPYIFTKGFSRRMCIGGTCGCTIDQDGNLFPCRLSNLKIGNVLETPLIELWNSDIARNVGNTIFNQPSQCYSCKELHQFCFYCPMKASINNIKQDQWVEYNCSLARRREILYHGN